MVEIPCCPRICIIGAGFSGIAAGIQLQRTLGMSVKDFVIYDHNADVGGVWMVNKYPGSAADVHNIFYSYSFAPNPDWSRQFAPQGEIQGYLAKVAGDHGLYASIRFNTTVSKLDWKEDLGLWSVSVLDKTTGKEAEEMFNTVISCVGTFHTPNIPKEFSLFQGPTLHSSRWENDIQLEGKVVAVVGAGSSAAQIIPGIVDRVARLISYQRHPSYVIPKVNRNYPKWLRRGFATLPGLMTAARWLLFWFFEIAMSRGLGLGLFRNLAEAVTLAYLKYEVGKMRDPCLLEKLTPDYRFGCRAPVASSDFYPALRAPNVEVVRSGITRVTQNSILTEDGETRQIDVLILATGFKVTEYLAPLEIRVKTGVDLLSLWKAEGPSAYMGMVTAHAPNLYLVGSIHSYSLSSSVFLIEAQVDYVMRVLGECRRRGLRVVAVKKAVEVAYMRKLGIDLEHSLWKSGLCPSGASWFLDESGRVSTVSPYSMTRVWLDTRRVDTEDFDFF